MNIKTLNIMKHSSIILFLLINSVVHAQKLSVYDLSCEHKINPIGIDAMQPRLTWKIKSPERNTIQSAYSIRVATDKNFSSKTLTWESGKLNSDESVLITYSGKPLLSGKRYYWQVRVWDNHNNQSAWSESAFWEMGLLKPEDWKASWIEPIQDTARHMPGLIVRRNFSLGKKIASARAYVTAHGLYELYLNGKKVSDEVLTPGWTSYAKRLQYEIYDITNMLQQGNNAIGAMLGDGLSLIHI